MPDNLTVKEKLEKLNKAFAAVQGKLSDNDEKPVVYDKANDRYVVSLYFLGNKTGAEALGNRIYDAILAFNSEDLPNIPASVRAAKKDIVISGHDKGEIFCLKLNLDNETARRAIGLTDRGVEPLANLAFVDKGNKLK